jgi:hypothetical protein
MPLKKGQTFNRYDEDTKKETVRYAQLISFQWYNKYIHFHHI